MKWLIIKIIFYLFEKVYFLLIEEFKYVCVCVCKCVYVEIDFIDRVFIFIYFMYL